MMLSKTPEHASRDAPNWIFLLGVIKQLQNGIFEKVKFAKCDYVILL